MTRVAPSLHSVYTLLRIDSGQHERLRATRNHLIPPTFADFDELGRAIGCVADIEHIETDVGRSCRISRSTPSAASALRDESTRAARIAAAHGRHRAE